jgi:hypothetical protein
MLLPSRKEKGKKCRGFSGGVGVLVISIWKTETVESLDRVGIPSGKKAVA